MIAATEIEKHNSQADASLLTSSVSPVFCL
jgi:hypothetical protein